MWIVVAASAAQPTVAVFDPADRALAEGLRTWIAAHPHPDPIGPAPFLLVKGDRYFREVTFAFDGPDPPDDRFPGVASDRYRPIRWGGGSGVEAADARAAFAGFAASWGFAPLALAPVDPIPLVRAPGGPFVGDLTAVDAAWSAVLVDSPCDLGSVERLVVDQVGATASHVYLRVHLTLRRCDGEAGGCSCEARSGADEALRLLVIPRGGRGVVRAALLPVGPLVDGLFPDRR